MGARIIRHGEPGFYETIGKAALNDRINKELGINITSQPGQIWFISESGFCSMKTKGRGLYLCHDYVYPMKRSMGAYRELFSVRNKYIQDHFPEVELSAVVTHAALPMYLKHDFTITKKLKNFTHVNRYGSNK